MCGCRTNEVEHEKREEHRERRVDGAYKSLIKRAASSLFKWLFAATLFVSSLSSEQAKTALFLGGFFLLMALGYFIQTVNGYSIYKWNDLFLHQAILSTSRLPWEKDLVLLLGIGFLLGGSLWAFRRRDF